MNAWGMLFMALSWGLILSLTACSFARVLRDRHHNNRGEDR